MNALGKLLFLLLVFLLQAGIALLLWDGDTRRLERTRAVVRSEAVLRDILFWEKPTRVLPDDPMAPLEFFDLIERDYPAAFARHFDIPTTEGLAGVYVEARDLGRSVYVREGCFHCHTTHVRPDTADVDRWGPPSRLRPVDVRRAGVPLLGLRRVGPDLANEAGRRSNDWQAAHLFRPQSILKGSVMPGYPWLFEQVDGRTEPTREGLALIVFLQSLEGGAP